MVTVALILQRQRRRQLAFIRQGPLQIVTFKPYQFQFYVRPSDLCVLPNSVSLGISLRFGPLRDLQAHIYALSAGGLMTMHGDGVGARVQRRGGFR